MSDYEPGLHILGREQDGDRWLYHLRLVLADEYDDDDVMERELPDGGKVVMAGGTATTTLTAWLWYCDRCRRNGEPRLMREVAIDSYDDHLPCEENPHGFNGWGLNIQPDGGHE